MWNPINKHIFDPDLAVRSNKKTLSKYRWKQKRSLLYSIVHHETNRNVRTPGRIPSPILMSPILTGGIMVWKWPWLWKGWFMSPNPLVPIWASWHWRKSSVFLFFSTHFFYLSKQNEFFLFLFSPISLWPVSLPSTFHSLHEIHRERCNSWGASEEALKMYNLAEKRFIPGFKL